MSNEIILYPVNEPAPAALFTPTPRAANAVLEMKVGDYFVQGRRGWVRLHEKGGKQHEVPCHHSLEKYLDQYITAARIVDDLEGPLFRTASGKSGRLTRNAMWQQDAYRMIQRRSATAGIRTRIGCHTFRATGITAYLKNKGTLEAAQHIAQLRVAPHDQAL